MTKKGSALMQVMVVGLIIATFAILMLRYAVTRSSNLSRTERILETQVIADSCLEQFMSVLAYTELYGVPPNNWNMNCLYYSSMTGDTPSTIPIVVSSGTGLLNSGLLITSFTVTQ